jgi:hypothetical protein
MTLEHAAYEKQSPISIITINMLERLNAYNTMMMVDTAQAFDQYVADDEEVVAAAGRGGMLHELADHILRLPRPPTLNALAASREQRESAEASLEKRATYV